MPALAACPWWPSLHASCPQRLPWPWLHALGGCLTLGSMPIGDALSFAACPGLSWLLAYGGYLGLGSIPMGATLALAACFVLGYLPMGATLALAACLSLGSMLMGAALALAALPTNFE